MDKELRHYLIGMLKDANRRPYFLRVVRELLHEELQSKFDKVKKQLNSDDKDKNSSSKVAYKRPSQIMRMIRNGAVPAGVLVSALMVMSSININKNNELFGKIFSRNKEKEARIYKFSDNSVDKLKIYQINNRSDFDQLFAESRANRLTCLLYVEGYKSYPHDDGNGYKCSIGIGGFMFPVDGNPRSSDWIKSSEYFKKCPEVSVDFRKACDLVDGWAANCNDGRVCNMLYEHLQGVSLTKSQFAAIYSVTYNNINNGMMLCDFVKNHQDNPVAVANFMVNLPCKRNFKEGILRRHTMEALCYLYPDMDLRYGIEGEKCNTAMSKLSLATCYKIKSEFAKGVTTSAEQVADRMSHWLCRTENMLDVANDKTYYFASNAILNGELLYAKALILQEKGQYEQAGKCYDDLLRQGYHGKEFYADASKCYLKLKKYENCVALNDVVRQEESSGTELNYYAGVAYIAKGDKEEATKFFSRARKANPDEYELLLHKTRDLV